MKGARISTVLALGVVTLVSLGATECSDDDLMVFENLAKILAGHEQRIDALERCDCVGILAPVCGEDGNTYVNRCEARCARTPIVAPGACESTSCGGDTGMACDVDSFCEIRPGCDEMAVGRCEEIPTLCRDVFDPVCGCDGTTYSNDCQRRVAGVPLDFRDDCANPPVECETNDECLAEEFCARRQGVCDDQLGVCISRPDLCPADIDPVCGCDGVTYSNACEAAVAGASVANSGRCVQPPVECLDSADCEQDEFCKTRLGMCGGDGICRPVPQACPQISNPVCGCDAESYANRCVAAREGVSLDYEGFCLVEICHFPPGNEDNFHTLLVGEDSVPAHKREHGDHLGACDEGSDPDLIQKYQTLRSKQSR